MPAPPSGSSDSISVDMDDAGSSISEDVLMLPPPAPKLRPASPMHEDGASALVNMPSSVCHHPLLT